MGNLRTKNPRRPRAPYLRLVSAVEDPNDVLPVDMSDSWALGRRIGLATLTTLLVVGAGWSILRGQGNVAPISASYPSPTPLLHGDAMLAFDVFVHDPKQGSAGRLMLQDETVPRGSSLSFVVFNRTGLPAHVAILGADDAHQVVGFYPSPTDAAGLSLPLPAAEISTLPEPRSPQPLVPGGITLMAVFSLQPLALRDIEAMYRRGGVDAVRGQAQFVAAQRHRLAP